MKRISLLISAVILMLGCVTALNAAATIYGMSGLVLTPDDSIVSTRTFVPAIARVFGEDGDLTTYGGAFGLLPNLEVSAVAADLEGGSTEGIINGKFRLTAESVDKPSVTVGILDLTQELSEDMSAFVVISKNISSVAEGVSGSVSKPIRGSLGFGTGFYDGFFAGLDMAFAPKCSLALEWIADHSVFSGVVRFQPMPNLQIQAGAIDFDDFFAGASYSLTAF